MTLFRSLFFALVLTTAAFAQDRATVNFQVNQTTSVGQSVYILGDLVELGGNDLTRAVKLEPSTYPQWRATISIPTNRPYSYRYYIRNDAPAQQRVATNGTAASAVLQGLEPGTPNPPATKLILYHSAFAAPVLNWRQSPTAAYNVKRMLAFGAGRDVGGVGERKWAAPSIGVSKQPVEFFFTPEAGGGAGRDPATGTYTAALDAFLVQDGNIFSYTPAAIPGVQRKDYIPASPPFINSTNLSNETRRYRVLLPRGYDQHTTRRYPVIYMHDGQNIFDQGPFGSWLADTAAALQVKSGAMRECIIVGADNTANRFADYTTPADGGRGDRYARFLRDELKPVIDANYRTLTDADNTGTIGSSLGAVISLYIGWDFTPTYTRLGLISGAWQATQIDSRASNETKRAVRIWMDSGDSGTSDDNYWLSYTLRDNLVKPNHAGGPYAIGGDLMHMIGFNQQHNEAAWAQRIGPAFSFLFPGTQEPSPFTPLATGARFDVNADSRLSIEDLYTQLFPIAPQAAADINADGTVNASDSEACASILRQNERATMTAGRM